MLTRKLPYTLLWCGALLAACTTDDEAVPRTAEAERVPIAFEVAGDETYKSYTTYKSYKSHKSHESHPTRSANGYTGNITAENHQLRYTGFGVFMAQTAASPPDMMFNQQVEYTFLADGSGKGYWTYSPLKYWPAQPEGVCIYAYAPYVPTPNGLAADATGIVGLSDNDEATPYILYARAKHPEENVDLLWSAQTITAAMLKGDDLRPAMSKAVTLQMHHALARVALCVGITNGTDVTKLPSTSKLLIQRVTLTGNFATTGKLNLTTTGITPTWYDQVLADPDTHADEATIFIDSDPDTHAASYGIIDETARYIPGLPVRWQPAGIPHADYDASDEAKKGNTVNLLCMGDAPSYLYLIPQSDLALTCVIDYCIIDAAGNKTDYHKTMDTAETPIHIAPLSGNKTYQLTFKITLE